MDRCRHKALLIGAALSASLLWPASAAQAQTAIITSAPTGQSAAALHAAGRYEAAIAKGRKEATLSGYVAAAKAGLFLAAYQEKDKKAARALLAQATQDAQAAAALAPEDIDANLQLTIAEGYAARIKMSPRRAKAARKRAEWLAAAAPNNGYVLGLLGGWHGEAVAAFGALIADVAVGAHTPDFERYFDAAIEASPNNALITAYYVRLLLDINDPGMRDKAVSLLSKIEEATPKDAFEAYMLQRAIALKEALEAGDKKALKRLVKSQRPFRDQK